MGVNQSGSLKQIAKLNLQISQYTDRSDGSIKAAERSASPQLSRSLDIGLVSILKTHISNPKTYELSHNGFLKKDRLKTQALKEIEQARRYHQLKQKHVENIGMGQYHKVRNTVNNQNFDFLSFKKSLLTQKKQRNQISRSQNVAGKAKNLVQEENDKKGDSKIQSKEISLS